MASSPVSIAVISNRFSEIIMVHISNNTGDGPAMGLTLDNLVEGYEIEAMTATSSSKW